MQALVQASCSPPPPSRQPAASDAEELDVFLGDRDFVMSFARGVSVIQAFAHSDRPMAIVEISEHIRVPRATVRRLLHTLCELGYVRQVGIRFALTPKTLELGGAFMSSNPGLAGMQPIITRLSDRLRAFSALMLPEGDQSLMVSMAGAAVAPAGERLAPTIGRKAPLYASASGQMFLSGFSEAQLEAYIARVTLLPLTASTHTVPSQLRAAVQRVRMLGYALCDRTMSNTWRSLAVPVYDRLGAMVAAVIAIAPVEQLDEEWLRSKLLPELQSASREIAERWR